MYNQQLEDLIEAALADGVLTEKEKEILFRKAQALGIDHDEFEMVLDARVTKLKAIAPKSNKMGDVRKCPACGAVVSADMATCPECGYAFSDIKANQSSTELAAKLQKIRDECMGKKYKLSWAEREDEETIEEKREREIYVRQAECVRSFPIPSTKADLMEFCTTMKAGANSVIDDDDCESSKLSSAYEAKYQECCAKIKALFPNDPQFASIMAHMEVDEKKRHTAKRKKALLICLLFIGLVLFFPAIDLLMVALKPSNKAIDKAVKDGDYEKAEMLISKRYEWDSEDVSGAKSLIDVYFDAERYDDAERVSKMIYPDYGKSGFLAEKKDRDAMMDFYSNVIREIATNQSLAAAKAYRHYKLIRININKEYDKRPVYEACRWAWKVSPKRANKADYVLAEYRGLVVGAYKVNDKGWQKVTKPRVPEDVGRYCFDAYEGRDINGNVISKDISDSTIKGLIGKRILPVRKRGAQTPVLYNYK